MPLDGICLGAVCKELAQNLIGCRVEKVYQPERDEVVLQIRGSGGARRLLFSVGANYPRVHLIAQTRENPAQPPMFCMLLRKHIQGAKLAAIEQPAGERMLSLLLDTTDEMGIACQKRLVCELIGRQSNLILCDGEGRILDALRRVEGDLSEKRALLPGLFYHQPPTQDKHAPLSLSGAGLCAAVAQAEGITLDKFLLQNVMGLSPLLCRELCFRAVGQTQPSVSALTDEQLARLSAVYEDFCALLREGRYTPYLLCRAEGGAMLDFSCMPITQYENGASGRVLNSFSDLLIEFYEKKGKAERMQRRTADLQRAVTTARDRLARKLAAQKIERDTAENREQLKRMGDLITANLYQLEKGMVRAEVIDYYEPDCPTVQLTLDARRSPQQNAQQYYKQYAKAKTAEQVLGEQIAAGEQELAYLESVLSLILQVENENDLAQLREELQQAGVLRVKKNGRKGREKPSAAKPFHYRTSDGFEVFAGKNNLQNDMLTLKTAFKSDIWFHTQKIHGSHIILVTDGKEPSEVAMTEAAMIAAYHSRAKNSAMVPVDYTPVRQVKKPAGAKPGMVIYHVYKTAYVTPDEAQVERMRIEENNRRGERSMILSGKEIERNLGGKIIIEPFDPRRVNPNSYNLSLANELLVYDNHELDMKKQNTASRIVIPEDGLLLEPGKLYLGRTNEYTKTEGLVPMLEGRSSVGRLGVFIHVTAGFGDVGFAGYWTLEIFCVQPIRIYPNVEICQIYYHNIDGEYDTYKSGKYQKNHGIQPSLLYKDFE